MGSAFSPPRCEGTREQGEIETLDRLAAFEGELGADAAFVFDTGDFVATGASEVVNPLLALFFQIRIVHKSRIGIR